MKHDRKTEDSQLDVLTGLVGAISFQVKATGGNDRDVANLFRSMADSYDERANRKFAGGMRAVTR